MKTESSDNNNDSTQNEHETHIPALVILVVVTAVISAGILTLSKSANFSTPQQETVRSQDDIPEEITYKKTTPVDTTEDLPSGLLSGNVDVVQNRSLELGSRNQRIVVFNAQASPQTLADQYRSWLQENDYRITSESVERDNVSFVGESNGDQLILVFSQNGSASSSRVQLSYVTPSQ